MHSFRGQQGTNFDFNPDLSGDLYIQVRTPPESVDLPFFQHCWVVKIPAQDVKELVLSRLAHEAVGMLEDNYELVEIVAKAAIAFLDRSGNKLLRRLLLGQDAGAR